jgi:hypothetical protein
VAQVAHGCSWSSARTAWNGLGTRRPAAAGEGRGSHLGGVLNGPIP